ncbi:MAG: YkgJ family cysteine cluster protein [Allosphingosinicella sp.]
MDSISPQSGGRDGSALCADCGLCCDGTLFDHAKAEPEELSRLAEAGLETYEVEGKPRFRLPCARLSGTRCTIYAERFTICRSYRCALLRDYLGGAVTLDEAREAVGTAKALQAKVAARAPEAVKPIPRRALTRQTAGWSSIADPAERVEAARLHLDLVALERFLDGRFRRKEAPGAPAEGR